MYSDDDLIEVTGCILCKDNVMHEGSCKNGKWNVAYRHLCSEEQCIDYKYISRREYIAAASNAFKTISKIYKEQQKQYCKECGHELKY